MKSAFIFTAFVLGVSFIACDTNKKQQSSSEIAEEANKETFENANNSLEEDSQFMIKAASGGMMEVELGKLAVNIGSNEQVKEFGQRMVEDHSKANQRLMEIASKKNITLPNAMNDGHQDKVKKLSKKTGTEYDKDYLDFMVNDHNDDIELFEDAVDNLGDEEVKAFAAETLPTLRNHQQQAEAIQKALKN